MHLLEGKPSLIGSKTMASNNDRVAENTSQTVNEDIAEQTEQNIARFSTAGAEEIDQRLEELDREWDIERVLQANAASLSLVGIGLGAFVDKRFLALPALVAGFLFQHAVQGWCPPVPVLRRLGFRTQQEIDQERYALKAFRGDFANVKKPRGKTRGDRTAKAVEAVTR
jgi:hypothetical protein